MHRNKFQLLAAHSGRTYLRIETLPRADIPKVVDAFSTTYVAS
jgi:hypothetical protein